MKTEPNWLALDRSGRTILKENPGKKHFICPGCGVTWGVEGKLDGRWYLYSDTCNNCGTYWEKIFYAYRKPTGEEISAETVNKFLYGKNGSTTGPLRVVRERAADPS
jgi:hypothetical protein